MISNGLNLMRAGSGMTYIIKDFLPNAESCYYDKSIKTEFLIILQFDHYIGYFERLENLCLFIWIVKLIDIILIVLKLGNELPHADNCITRATKEVKDEKYNIS